MSGLNQRMSRKEFALYFLLTLLAALSITAVAHYVLPSSFKLTKSLSFAVVILSIYIAARGVLATWMILTNSLPSMWMKFLTFLLTDVCVFFVIGSIIFTISKDENLLDAKIAFGQLAPSVAIATIFVLAAFYFLMPVRLSQLLEREQKQ